jgi:hypothetical protein
VRESGLRAASLFSTGRFAQHTTLRRCDMFAIFVGYGDDGINFSQVYALCCSEMELEEELRYLECHGASWYWRQI